MRINRSKRAPAPFHLSGIDAPESDQPDGIYAQEQSAKLIGGREIRIDAKEQKRPGIRRADLYVGKVWINLEMVQSGFAWVAPGRYTNATFLVAEGRARVEGRGLWGFTAYGVGRPDDLSGVERP
jgi:micrococcal nuclease